MEEAAGSKRRPTQGRGAVGNVTHRFERYPVESFDDGWYRELPERGPSTEWIPRAAKTLIRSNDSPDIPFEHSINPYQGCEHGCIYCFARPTHAFWDYSPGMDFETKILFKPNAVELLHRELRQKNYRCTPIALGTNTDPYQPIERERRATRALLEVLSSYRHPFSIVTKSGLIRRDIDLLAEQAAAGRTMAFLSITTLDPELACRMEPRAASPSRRLETVRLLADAGIPVGVMASPMVPGLNDHELEAILEAAHQAGASMASTLLLRLPLEVAPLFVEWVEAHYPDRASKVLGRIRSMRGGKLNDSRFGHRMRGEGPWAALLSKRFHTTARRLGLAERRQPLDTGAFRLPPRAGDQRGLFD